MRQCRFPGCEAESERGEAGAGRPPEYCARPEHNRGAAWRARQADRAARQGQSVPDDLGRPVAMARARAGEFTEQVGHQVSQLSATLIAVLEELRTLGDPDAAAAQIEAVTTEAEQRTAEATARAARAEQDRREAVQARAEADGAAEEAVADLERLTAELGTAREERRQVEAALTHELEVQTGTIAALTTERDQLAGQLQEQTARADRGEAAAADQADRADALMVDLAAARASLEQAHLDAALAAQQVQDLDTARAAAVSELEAERSRSAAAHAVAATAAGEATRLREELTEIRSQLQTATTDLSTLRTRNATLDARLAAALTRFEDEQTHTAARLADQRASYEERLSEVRTELARVSATAAER